jgi:HlyD family secretion protein
MITDTLPPLDELKQSLSPGASSPWTRRKWILGSLALVASCALLLAMTWNGKQPKVQYEQTQVIREDLRVTVRSTGSLQAVTSVEVGAEVSGRVVRILVDVNDEVRKGQILAEIDPEQFSSGLDQSKAQLVAAEAAIRLAEATASESERNLKRNRRLQEEGILAQAELDSSLSTKERADASLRSAQENWRVAKAARDMAASKLQKTIIRAPIDGVVLARLVEPGQTVTAGFTTPVLFKLAQDMRKMRLNVDIDEADVSRIRPGQTATFTVEAYPGRDFPSAVVSLEMDPKVSQNVVTYRAVLRVDNTERALLPGMTCTATIQTEIKPQALVVPNAALRFQPTGSGTSGLPGVGKGGINLNDGRHRVWILGDKGPEPIEVKTGATNGRVTEVLSDQLKEGMQVLTDAKEPA